MSMYLLNALQIVFFKVGDLVPDITHFEKKSKCADLVPNFFKVRCHKPLILKRYAFVNALLGIALVLNTFQNNTGKHKIVVQTVNYTEKIVL